MARIDSAQVPQLPVAFMNADHAVEVRLLNEIEVALSEHRRGAGTLGAVLEKLSVFAVHMRGHFLREESLMRERRFAAYAAHKAEHDRVLSDMNEEARLFRERGDGDRLARYLFQALPDRLVNHIRSMDLVTARSAGPGPSPEAR